VLTLAGRAPDRLFTMSLVATEVLEIEAEIAGPAAGRPVLLLHGWPDAPRGWTAVAGLLHAAGWRTIAPFLRGSGATRFRSPDTPRDALAPALAQDAVDLMDALGLESVPVVGHDWGARAAYTLAALFPQRVSAIAALALPYQPRGRFTIPPFRQARAFWYQWFLCLDQGAAAVARDPVAFARLQWETWSPPGWYDDAEFAATAASFRNPDWVPITLNGYRSRFLAAEARDPRYERLAERLAGTETISVPTLMLQGGADLCDEPASSEGLDGYFTGGYRREVIAGAGHFPHREAPELVAAAVLAHLGANC
jgi:pimeloyl-ACP methyl ester carboxylesterase